MDRNLMDMNIWIDLWILNICYQLLIAIFLFYYSGVNLINKKYGEDFLNGNGLESFKVFFTENKESFNMEGEHLLSDLETSYRSMFDGTSNYANQRFVKFLTSIN